ncbi:mesaconyl-C4 CoA hydratase [Amycolatopsis keratiniphila]|uniref:Mesaconyl-C4 CoA hydratase n=1 Tax=Amycolatopsis keratiniphila TaxID=129921 RepID=R4T9B4_9PSEU|nr:mesaconyl-C4 CoA hydratase [Amycolatopsis keratiniphila]AGM07502.1 mesaconyl-C4 CoA hydratase [Amycolatopsis keratiniphila]
MREILQPGPAEALASLLDVDLPDLDRDGLPPLWHWFYLLDRPAQADLGPDGHPMRGKVPEPGRRRMWAGGRVRTLGLLRCGLPAERHTEVLSTREKQGRTGRLTFVVTGHRIVQDGAVVVEEEQDIVYRDAASGQVEAAVEEPEVPVAEDEWAIDVSPTLLFRFSALTYNAHRIHYDRDYARDVEGYPGLLTHGPLQALAMAEAARRRGSAGRLAFDYRLVSPLFDHQGMIVRADESGTAVRDRHGRRTAIGTMRSLGR